MCYYQIYVVLTGMCHVQANTDITILVHLSLASSNVSFFCLVLYFLYILFIFTPVMQMKRKHKTMKQLIQYQQEHSKSANLQQGT